MKRKIIRPRKDWIAKNEALGFDYNVVDGHDYWVDDQCYELNMEQVVQIESAVNELHQMFLTTMGDLVRKGNLGLLRFPDKFIPAIERSWNLKDMSIYGRFDLSYDGINAPKLLEYNAETPTSLVESAVIQWQWLEDQYEAHQIPHKDQFNSVHDKLVEGWQRYSRTMKPGEKLHMVYYGEAHEDFRTVEYMVDVAKRAGIMQIEMLPIEDLGSNGKILIDGYNEQVKHLFKLYPFEWMMKEQFQDVLLENSCKFIEPLWKTALSNKAFLPLLWEKFPKHPNLLAAYMEPGKLQGEYAKKPIFGREGNNVTLHSIRGDVETQGEYGGEGFIYQELCTLPRFDDRYAQVGAWVVNGESAGICIREDQTPIIGNFSTFVPHYFVE